MNEKTGKDEVDAQIERGHFPRAAFLAASVGIAEEKVRDLRLKALWQMAAIYRNGPGTRRLAQQYGLSRKEVAELLEKCTEEAGEKGDDAILEPCYDCNMTRHVPFGEWKATLLKDWGRLNIS